MKRLFIFLSLLISILFFQMISCGSAGTSQNNQGPQNPIENNPPSSDLDNLPSDVALQGVVDGQNIVLKESEITSEVIEILDYNMNGVLDPGEGLEINITKDSYLNFSFNFSDAYFIQSNQIYFLSSGNLSGLGNEPGFIQYHDVTSGIAYFSRYLSSTEDQRVEGTFSVILSGENNWLVGRFHSSLMFFTNLPHPGSL